MDLGERKFRILQAIIDDFILNAAPVGSRTISRKIDLGLSSATIRNEMSDLEELGYLAQPHTSAGRIPSHKAFRLYVDQLMRLTPLSVGEQEQLRAHFNARVDEAGSIMMRVAQVLSDATSYTSLVLPAQVRSMKLRRVQFVPLTDTTALVVIVTDAGVAKDAVIRIPVGVTPDYLYALSALLTEQVQDHTLEQLRSDFIHISRTLNLSRESFIQLMDMLDQHLDAPASELVVGGSANLLAYPEYADIEKARQLLIALDTREKLADILVRSSHMDFSITIGAENELQGLKDCSLVTIAYHVGDQKLGSLGIIGPTRMDYPRVMAVLETVRQMMSRLVGAMSDAPQLSAGKGPPGETPPDGGPPGGDPGGTNKKKRMKGG